MAKVYENGIYRDITQEELSQLEQDTPDALTEMVEAMSTATTLAQMRSAAKTFLDRTEVN